MAKSATKRLYGSFLWMDGVQLPQGYSHYEEAVYNIKKKKKKGKN